MSLKALQKNWDAFGREKPLEAILTPAGGGTWDREAFFRTGVDEIASVLAYVRGLGLDPGAGAALDFGCGIGRLTQALAGHFETAYGVDIAPSMIERARVLNRAGTRCQYVLNEGRGLAAFGRGQLDFVYSNIVLQHMEPRYARGYIAEFLRVLRPGGVAVFQIPDGWGAGGRHPLLRRLAPHVLRRVWSRLKERPGPVWKRLLPGGPPVMDMYWIPRRRVEAIVRGAGGAVRDVAEDDSCGGRYRSLRYCVVRTGAGGHTRRPK